MCGLYGLVNTCERAIMDKLNLANEAQGHRGPDMAGTYVCSLPTSTLGLAHQRLSILDLSDAGMQPMKSQSTNSVIAYNGEVYNFKELSSDLSHLSLNSNSDTEVILELFEKYGFKSVLNRLNGMWAIAYYDTAKKKLYLSRDRAGVKPLYYTLLNGQLIFSSEIKTILQTSDRKFKIDANAVSNYLEQSIQDINNSTFFEEIYSVPAGTYCEIDLTEPIKSLKFERYWSPTADRKETSFEQAVAEAKEVFDDAVKLRMRSDVPVGVTLSGGLDSSAIASMMKKHLVPGQELLVLSAVSPGSKEDESEFIDIMSRYLNVNVNKVELNWTAEQAITLLKEVSWYNDSPVGSFSNVAHYLLMKEAKKSGIKVILSGQGADELLCGYKKYPLFYLQQLLRDYDFIQAFKLISGFVGTKSVLGQLNFLESKRYLPSFLSKRKRNIFGSKLQQTKSINLGLKVGQSVNERQIEDLEKYSVPYLTHYEDRMSMAWAREIRLPFLDYRLMEMFINLPSDYKIRDGWTKYVFREAMKDYLPTEITWRKDKQGFVNPQEDWLKKELKSEVEKVFSEDALIFSMNLINRSALLENYHEFCQQKQGKGKIWYREIFQPLALEVWLQQYKTYIDEN